MLAVAGGLCRHVLCFRTVWESTAATLGLGGGAGRTCVGTALRVAGTVRRDVGGALDRHERQPVHASLRHDAEMLGWIAINGRANAARNPAAIYRDPMTMDDYMSARPITTPFGLYDCDVPCDASIAVVVSDASVAADLPRPAVRVEAVGTQINERVSWEQDTITHEPQVLGQSAHLWTRTSVRPSDIDVALVYDGFTFNAITWLEALGFCGLGEAKDWLDGGRRIALDGEFPVNTHGGQLSEGRTHGFGFVYEAMAQLRHDAGERQVADVRDGTRHLGRRHPVERAVAAPRRRVSTVQSGLHVGSRREDRAESRLDLSCGVVVGEHVVTVPADCIDDVGGDDRRLDGTDGIHTGLDAARHDDAHADRRADGLELEAEDVGESEDTVLGHRVRPEPVQRQHGGHRRHVDDVPLLTGREDEGHERGGYRG